MRSGRRIRGSHRVHGVEHAYLGRRVSRIEQDVYPADVIREFLQIFCRNIAVAAYNGVSVRSEKRRQRRAGYSVFTRLGEERRTRDRGRREFKVYLLLARVLRRGRYVFQPHEIAYVRAFAKQSVRFYL